MRNKKDRR